MSEKEHNNTEVQISNQNVNDQVQRITQSPAFANSPRLAEFLEHVVQEVIRGNGQRIRAKSIGLDLYHYDADEIEQRVTVVRVDAGRVRKKLRLYYDEYAANDEIIIDLPTGSYAPVFRLADDADGPDISENGHSGATNPRLVLAAGVFLCVLAIATVSWSFLVRDPASAPGTGSSIQRTAIFEDSPARLRAINLAEQGRSLVFPAVDPGRLDSALRVFELAIKEDPNYFGGYAGAAQVHATLALLSLDAQVKAEQTSMAEKRSARAKHLAPGSAWSLSAQAWLDFVQNNCQTALRLSERAARSNPSDPHIAEFDALISLFCDKFDRVKARVATIMPYVSDDAGFVFTNALGSVLYHEGDYRGTVEQFESSIADGGPTGPISLAYLIGANFRMGELERAGELIQLYDQYFPDRRIDLLLSRLYVNPAYGEDLSGAIEGASSVLK